MNNTFSKKYKSCNLLLNQYAFKNPNLNNLNHLQYL